MNGTIIIDTPIAVDFWQIRQRPSLKIFFLSHMHADHTKGLSASWRRLIYCSPVTARLVTAKLHVPASLIKPLEIGQSHIIPLDDTGQETMTVTLIEANHCPGAVIFLFEGYFGRILYTGDFRYDPSMVSDTILSNCGTVDKLYLDNTYNMPGSVFPSRSECTARIIEIIERYPAYEVVVGLHKLGKEDMLVDIAMALKTRIVVNPDRLKTLKILEMSDVFTLDSSCSRIRVVPQHFVTRKNVDNWQEGAPTIAILPTALYTSIESQPFADHPDVFVVPYSDHSSYSELVEFVSRVKPRSVTPIVGASRFGLGNGNMSVFDRFLDKQTRSGSSGEIPPSVLSFMNSAKGGDVMIPSKKLKIYPAKRPITKELPKGVVFDDAVDEDVNKELERRKEFERQRKHDSKAGVEGECADVAYVKQSSANADLQNGGNGSIEHLSDMEPSLDTSKCVVIANKQPFTNCNLQSVSNNSMESVQDKEPFRIVAPDCDGANDTLMRVKCQISNNAFVKNGAGIIANGLSSNITQDKESIIAPVTTGSLCDNNTPSPNVHLDQDGSVATSSSGVKVPSSTIHIDHDRSTATSSLDINNDQSLTVLNNEEGAATSLCDKERDPIQADLQSIDGSGPSNISKATCSKSRKQTLVFTVKPSRKSKSSVNLGTQMKQSKRKEGTDVLTMLRASASKKAVKGGSKSDDDVILLTTACNTCTTGLKLDDSRNMQSNSSSDESFESNDTISRSVVKIGPKVGNANQSTRQRSEHIKFKDRSHISECGSTSQATRPRHEIIQDSRESDNSPLQDCTPREVNVQSQNQLNNDKATRKTISHARNSVSSSGLLILPYSVRPVNRKRKRGQRPPSFAELFEKFSQK